MSLTINKLEVTGLRGCPTQVVLAPNGKSITVLAENGFGKSTFADACYLWSHGDLLEYHREGAKLDAAISLDADRATVGVQAVGHPMVTRTLVGRNVSAHEVSGPRGDNLGDSFPGAIPLLRHGTMRDFVSETPGKKKRALLDLLGLTGLTDLRSALSTATTRAKRRSAAARDRLREAQDRLNGALEGTELGTHVERLSRTAGVDLDLSGSTLATARLPTATDDPAGTRARLTDELASVVLHDDTAAIDGWNGAVADAERTRDLSVRTLLDVGQRALSRWDADSCPLCLVGQDRADLAERVSTRAVALAAATAELDPHRRMLQERTERLARAQSILQSLKDATPDSASNSVTAAEDAAQVIKRDHARLSTAIAESTSYCPVDPAALADCLATLRTSADADRSSAQPAKALSALHDLQNRLNQVDTAERELESAETITSAASAALDIVDGQTRDTIKSELERLSGTIARFYDRLHGTPFFSNVRLDYTDSRDGGVEFSFTFKGREISPPQRVMSESQLGSLGLALFLARLTVAQDAWRTLVLDDVVNSFDASHRAGLARLLRDEFNDWQVISFTHDSSFHKLLQLESPGWRADEIVRWDPDGGPVFADGNPRGRLRTQLDAGVAANELRGHARQALEATLRRPVVKLGLRIAYRESYTARDYLTALSQAQESSGGSLMELPIIRTMEARTYVTNLLSHYQPDGPEITSADLEQLLDDLASFEDAFRCDDCGTMVWYAERANRRGHQCKCSDMAV